MKRVKVQPRSKVYASTRGDIAAKCQILKEYYSNGSNCETDYKTYFMLEQEGWFYFASKEALAEMPFEEIEEDPPVFSDYCENIFIDDPGAIFEIAKCFKRD